MADSIVTQPAAIPAAIPAHQAMMISDCTSEIDNKYVAFSSVSAVLRSETLEIDGLELYGLVEALLSIGDDIIREVHAIQDIQRYGERR